MYFLLIMRKINVLGLEGAQMTTIDVVYSLLTNPEVLTKVRGLLEQVCNTRCIVALGWCYLIPTGWRCN